jgi:hypothetical protein
MSIDPKVVAVAAKPGTGCSALKSQRRLKGLSRQSGFSQNSPTIRNN